MNQDHKIYFDEIRSGKSYTKLNDLEKRLDKLEKNGGLFGKNTFLFTIAAVALVSVIGTSFTVVNSETGLLQQNLSERNSLVGGQHVIESLRNDSVDTWMAWHIPDQTQLFHIHVVDETNRLTQDKLAMIQSAIMSENIIEIDDSTLHKGPKGSMSSYYEGWVGALDEANKSKLKYRLPLNLHTHTTDDSKGAEIIVKLTDERSSEGYSGFTHSIIDKKNNEILKSFITVYESGNLSGEEIAVVVKHEMGHAFGLKHSTDPDDLMYHEIQTSQPYISECNLDALVALYQGQEGETIRCSK